MPAFDADCFRAQVADGRIIRPAVGLDDRAVMAEPGVAVFDLKANEAGATSEVFAYNVLRDLHRIVGDEDKGVKLVQRLASIYVVLLSIWDNSSGE